MARTQSCDERPLRAEDMEKMLDDALNGVSQEAHPERIAWTLWGIGPWSSMTDTIRHLYGLLRERHGESVDAHAPIAGWTHARKLEPRARKRRTTETRARRSARTNVAKTDEASRSSVLTGIIG